MRIASRDRLWLLGGLIAALLLTVLVWQFFIKSQNDTTNSVKADIVGAQQQVQDSTRQLNQLKADSANLAKYQAALAADQAALPSNSGIPAFLNELHDAGDQTSVGILSLTVGQPVLVDRRAGRHHADRPARPHPRRLRHQRQPARPSSSSCRPCSRGRCC